MKAYSKNYLEDAKENLAVCFDYAVNDSLINPDTFMFMFVNSKYAKLFATGNPSIISGMSGVELARNIIYENTKIDAFFEQTTSLEKSKEYWAGYYLAEYQWYTGKSFKNIFHYITLSEIIDMYHPYHEMDITHFIKDLNKRIHNKKIDSKLKTIRLANGISQSELSNKSGVGLRSIQMYEQKQNDIDKAQVNTLYKLAYVLNCDIEDLLEHVDEK